MLKTTTLRMIHCTIGLSLVLSAPVLAESEIPAFLPSYYAPFFKVDGALIPLAFHKNENGDDAYVYVTADQSTSLRVESFPCAQSVCDALYDAAFKTADQAAAGNDGIFDYISSIEFRVAWKAANLDIYRFAFVMPGSMLIWTYARTGESKSTPVDEYYNSLTTAVNRQRLELAQPAGNVEMGRYDTPLRKYAEQLIKSGQKREAVSVLAGVIATSPTDYQAQIEFATNTNDSSAARNSAQVVWDNAESSDLLVQSGKLLGNKEATAEDIPILDKGETGLQVILIPLAPCDVYLLKEAGDVYTRITGIPVKIRRLKDDWLFGSPDRIPNERAIQQIIVQNRGANVDFSTWTLEQYETELLRVASTSGDPVIRYRVNAILSAAGNDAAQYDVVKYLPKLSDMLASYRSDDPRTMYVGITGANIASGDANYLFSEMEMLDKHQTDILSYYMMKASSLGEPYESRKRLTERIAKELVPATLNALGIPRLVDPTDPFSYSSGVDRLDQKTLVLSKPTQDALAKFR